MNRTENMLANEHTEPNREPGAPLGGSGGGGPGDPDTHTFFLWAPWAGASRCAGKACWYRCRCVAAALYSLYRACGESGRRGG